MSETEAYCLERILKRLLRFTTTGQVEYFHLGRRRWYVKQPHRHPDSGRFRFHFKETNGTVYRNRLHWMIENRQPIPVTHFVDHIDENRHNDEVGNLRLMKVGESHAQGLNIQIDATLEMLRRWFQFVGRELREPVTEHEILFVETGF